MPTWRLSILMFLMLSIGSTAYGFAIFQVNSVVATAAFFGNPNTTVTATTAGLATSRTSCQTPCYIHVSASATTGTCTGSVHCSGGALTKPYEDLQYSWNCGDASSTEVFTNPATATSVNANTDQAGPDAVCVYRSSAGSPYTVTLTAKGRNGASTVSSTATQAITVSTFNPSGGEFWFDSVNGSDSNNGLSSGAPKQTLSALNALLGSNKAFHLAKGSSWNSTGSGANGILDFEGLAAASNIRVDAYGSGAKPIFNANAAGKFAVLVENSGGSKTDFVFTGIKFTNSGSATNTGVVEVNSTGLSSRPVTQVYFDNCDIVDTLSLGGNQIEFNGVDSSGGWSMSQVGMWGGSITSPQSTSVGRSQGWYGGGKNWTFAVGFSISGGGSDVVLDHQMYPQCQTHCLFQWITFGLATTRNYMINTNWDSLSGSLEIAQYYTMSQNLFGSNVSHGIDGSIGSPADDCTKVQFKDFVIQQNSITNMIQGAGDAGFGYAMTCSYSLTFRDNKFYGNSTVSFYAPNLNATNTGNIVASLYRNWSYRSSSTGITQNFIEVSNPVDGTYNYGQWTLTDNIFMDTSTTANVFDPVSSKFASPSPITGRNTYCTPNDADQKFLASPVVTFSVWQAIPLDTTSSSLGASCSIASWPSPSTGNMGTWPLGTP